MEIQNFKLVGDDSQKIKQKPSPNHSGIFKSGMPDTIIIHYTAGRNAKESVNTLCNPARKASAHLVIGRDNSITQLVDFNMVAWHAGESSYQGRSGFNQYSIGIEIDNCGYLVKQGDDYLSWFGGVYQQQEAYEGRHRNPNVKYDYWLRYTEWQISIVEDICSLLIAEFNIKFILGHEEISPGRKIDPGPAFPLDKMRDHLLNSDRSSDSSDVPPILQIKKGIVKCDRLNIRADANLNAVKISEPLIRGTIVTILDEKPDWYYVDAGLKGWVASKFINLVS